MQPVILPVLGANMTHGTVRAWFKQEGDRVEVGDALFEVETDKVNAHVEAEAAGVVRLIVAPAGSQVPVLGIVAFVGAANESVPAPDTWGGLVPVAAGTASENSLTGPTDDRSASAARAGSSPPAANPVGAGRAATNRRAASPAARRLARERGVALDRIRGTGSRGEVTCADVEAAEISVPRVQGDGQMDAAFLQMLRRDAASFRALASDVKVHLYRLHGAQIGEGVRIEPGALIIAQEIGIGAVSTIGADSTIECDRFRLGRLVAFGKRTRIHCREVEIGDALWSKDEVVIGGGGSNEPGACLTAGAACFFGEGAYLNTCHPLRLGDEVCIGSRAMLFTHSHWQSVLRGYPSLFGPIVIGDHVFVGNNAFIFPGVTVGSGVTVMVNSFVALNVPQDTLVGGVPAQVIRHIVAPSHAEQTSIVRDRLIPELAAGLAECGRQVTRRDDNDDAITLDLGNGAAVRFLPSWDPASQPQSRRLVMLTFAQAPVTTLPAGITWFDLSTSRISGVQDELSDEVREFCRRRGIRFQPFAWRYGVGHFEGDRFYSRARR
ncbi:MAG: biotin/lipoyl-containing protein [Candidatus Binatia bacterium]